MSSVTFTMDSVIISEKGVIQNILSLNYDHKSTVKEYLNNVLDKNHPDTQPGYGITIDMKKITPRMFMFEFMEEHATGFQSLDDIKRAFRIADSERTGVNNMGYGIYSPLTINNNHEAYGLFLQHNNNGSYYSIVYFGSSLSKIWTLQGEFDGTSVLGINVSELIVPGGTRSVWITEPDNNDEEDDLALDPKDSIRHIIKQYRRSLTKDTIQGDVRNEIMKLGKDYNFYLENGVSIKYGNESIEAIDILKADEGRTPASHSYAIAVAEYDTKKEYRISEEGSETWCAFTKTSKSIGGEITNITRNRDNNQYARIEIHDIDMPNDKRDEKKRKTDKKIWVKIGEKYIFSEDFPLNGHPNIRVVLNLDNFGNNEFGMFISPDANKSNSKINTEIKERINHLVKFTIRNYFKGVTGRVQVGNKIKHEAYLNYTRNLCTIAKCSDINCVNEVTPWEFDLTKIDASLGEEVTNLIPICKPCGKLLD